MGIEQHRDRVIGRIKQAISQSGVNTSAIPAEQLDRLVNSIGMACYLNSTPFWMG
ncbi:MAG: hypothetical protein HC853_14265 [Anaerolineae bacterium]|nr:hypothetical protein [Anaerolineae bacterium]